MRDDDFVASVVDRATDRTKEQQIIATGITAYRYIRRREISKIVRAAIEQEHRLPIVGMVIIDGRRLITIADTDTDTESRLISVVSTIADDYSSPSNEPYKAINVSLPGVPT